MAQSIERFSSRVENYVRYRPGYPSAIIDLLKADCGLTSQHTIADLGSGTGKLSEIFLENGNIVIGVEPNAAMRTAADIILQHQLGFRSVEGSAESTSLPTASVDFVTAGQAFHWFDPAKAKTECARILRPEGWAVLVWNERLVDTTPFLCEYETLLLKYGTDYQQVRHENAVDAIAQFFAPQVATLKSFTNYQEFDFAGLEGRVLSSSYTPEPDQATFEPMLRRLREIFERHQLEGKVSFDYETKVYYAHLSNDPDATKRE